MKWSWKLGEFRGIAVYMHATFLILIGFAVLSHWLSGHSPGKTLEGVAFVLALFTCVVLPEFGSDSNRCIQPLSVRRSGGEA